MGHKPGDESTKIKILSYDEAKKKSNDNVSYDTKKWIYIPNFYSDYRYILGTVGENPLIVIGVNPSTASPKALDNTLKSVERIAHNNGYDSFIMFNVYAQRATKPTDLDKIFNVKLHEENMKAFRDVLECVGESPKIWVAWGTSVTKRKYLKKCLEDIIAIGNNYEAMWVKAGKISKYGHPHHPLYLSKNSTFDKFDMKDYLTKI